MTYNVLSWDVTATNQPTNQPIQQRKYKYVKLKNRKLLTFPQYYWNSKLCK